MGAKQAKLCAKRAALAAGRLADHERYTKHITFLTERIGEAASFSDQVTAHRAAVAALPPHAPSATQTATRMVTLLGEARVLLEKAFGFANVAASKVRRSVAAPARGWLGCQGRLPRSRARPCVSPSPCRLTCLRAVRCGRRRWRAS